MRPLRTPGLRITTVVGGDAVWLRVEGDLERTTALDLTRAISAAERKRPGTVGLDASQVAFVDAAGLHVLLAAARRARQSGRRFVVAYPSPHFHRLLSIAALSAIEISPSRREGSLPDGPG